MARVFLATESALDRQVVIKVLAPELAQSVSAERFHREIHFAAKLQHPHIVPLLSAGQAGDLLYYTMPFVAGESLKACLDRKYEVSVPDAVRLLAQVARALAYAHSQGVLHRDIKPGNILLSQGEAQVTDFGIAKALSEAANADALTTCGLVLGTPSYMPPEQALSGELDPRADLYSLGVVAYEMLTGTLPFSGHSLHAVLAAQVQGSPPEPSTLNSAVPLGVGSLVMQLLERRPADRPQTADDVVRVLESSTGRDFGPSRTGIRRRPVIHWGRWLTGGSIAGLGLMVGLIGIPRDRELSRVDPAVVAVIPFKVTGADSSLRYLREGMLDLLVAKLSGTPNLRAVDPRTMLRAWPGAVGSDRVDIDRAGALRLARRLGAGQLLEGEVVGTSQALVLTASIIPVGGGSEIRASVEGQADSLTRLVDRLAAQLLALSSGGERYRLAALTTTSLPALHAWLNGRAAHRRGDYVTARDLFDESIEHDSTFALAGLSRQLSAVWLGETTAGPGTLVAWRHRDRLSRQDLTFLRFMLGSRYPVPGSARDDLLNGDALIAAKPDDPEAWAAVADHMFHYGSLIGVPDASVRSIRLYERSLTLDSSYAPIREHLVQLYYVLGDTLLARRTLDFQLREASPNAHPLQRWFARTFLNDNVLGAIAPSAQEELLAAIDGVVSWALRYGGGVAEAESLLLLRRTKVASEGERRALRELAWTYYVNCGQPKKALAWMQDLRGSGDRAEIILGAIYADADSLEGARLARSTPRADLTVTTQRGWQSVVEQYAAAQYYLHQGHTERAREVVRAWSQAWTPEDASQVHRLASHLALLLDAQLAAAEDRSNALVRLTELDSILQTGPTYDGYLVDEGTFGGFEPIGNLVAGRLWIDRGEPARALAAVRRRAVSLPSAVFITQLREEGNYAKLMGDKHGAIRAYRHYLALRNKAEDGLQRQVRTVRAELAALEPATEVR